ncbi:MAG: 4Fe-4S binding protein [Spirochaetes bacterium]|nr:4Fe-4S binding protein [Spirochaetota bacterium]
MESEQTYQQLCAKMGLPQSASLAAIWKLLCTDMEAAMAGMLPGTADELAAKSGKTRDEVDAILLTLFKKGVVFKAPKDGAIQYKLAKNIVQFHDASLLWDGATQEYYDLWKKVMDQDFTGFMKSLPDSVKLPSFMRVVPVHESIEPRSTVLTYEECARIIDESDQVAVVNCPCRLSQKNCDAPVENCIQVNRGAEYVIDRGHGRKITKQEAMDIIKQAEEAGLVHMTENRLKGNAICNCCGCCCEMFRLMEFTGKKWILSPSRYLAEVGEECTACGACLDACPVHAITLGDIAVIDADACMGCGVCATVCPVNVIRLNQVRPAEHIPQK